MVKAGADTALTNRGGKTGWQLAAAAGRTSKTAGWQETIGVLEKYAAKGGSEALACEGEWRAANAAVAALEAAGMGLDSVIGA